MKTHFKRSYLKVFLLAFLVVFFAPLFFNSYSITGTLFLGQSVAIFVILAVKLISPARRKNILSWLAAAVMTILIILFSYFVFHYGPRIITEADGPAAIGYSCELGELDQSIVNLTGENDGDFTNNSLTANLCMLKNVPLAASNISPYSLDYNNDGGVMFVIYEAIIATGFFLTKYYTASSKSSKSLTA